MGWINQDSFTAPGATPASRSLTCTLPETPLFSDGPFCGKICANDVDCPSGQACKGAANKFVNAKLGDAVTVCTVFTPAAPPTRVRRGSSTPALPRGRRPFRRPPANVGRSRVGGRCAPNFILVAKDGQCHKNCSHQRVPAATKFCSSAARRKVCTANREFLQVRA